MVSLIARDHALGMVEEVYQGMLYIIDSICASVSYVLGYVSNGLATEDGRDARLIKCLVMTRALYLAAQVPSIPTAQRNWILSAMEFIGLERGIGQTLVLRDQLIQMNC
jgi:hypothetical protein